MARFVKFYADKGNISNYLYTFKVKTEMRALKVIKKFKNVRSAYFVEKNKLGGVISSKRIL